ncbi:MAG: hypothetical protein ACLVJ8_05265 [Ruthenibacterium lactatiformans]
MRETENTAYARKREFLLCTDICGSALDTLRSRQEQAYCPALVECLSWRSTRRARRAGCLLLEGRLREFSSVCCHRHVCIAQRGPPCRGWTASALGGERQRADARRGPREARRGPPWRGRWPGAE